MKKILVSAAVAVAMGAPLSVMAEDAFNNNNASTVDNGAFTVGALSPSTNTPISSYNGVLTGSQNTTMTEAYNEINSDNVVAIAEDGNVIFAQNADQAIASNDMDATVSGNEVVVDGASTVGALSPATNASTSNTRTISNTISGSFSGAAGIAMVSQNTGHASSIQQSTVVQSNFNIN